MCRHLAYLGPPVPLAGPLFDAPHSLERQSWAPRDMRGGGTINADGFGIGWYTPDGALVRYRRDRPLWSLSDLPALAASIHAGAFLAAVRSATVGMPITETAAAPFAGDGWLFSHNGRVTGWPDSAAALPVPPRDLLTLDAPTDSALLWTLVRTRLRTGMPLDAALADVVALVSAAAPGSRLNLLVTDGTTIAATTCGHSLSVHAEPGRVLVASEPLDPSPAWQPVPDGTLLTATATTVNLRSVES
ncbi:ergothioneine biosynthesis protein EgtC [Dactylosporangium sucinum]|uniref:Gamma-glutamyl-hercynylcysteine sulfoxide hydrolase n=1 Tax=Dactylosporangium sucinum TaxID=1424081 RepID=A0A917U7U8_9ACTN|nr:ergothioneine biosynthesis protein EgtC [Dactylosporangium sucinum]GGM61484.1 gamma-glutamyl-hercynylcysteine sulfoxide hydrolase [Dactylosporangium sucinum]